ncbi:MAG: hypothetical protein M3371_12695 [Acidobacteriota bacterium]|nr:hypothetical protein [Acidobacteriota bacterium]
MNFLQGRFGLYLLVGALMFCMTVQLAQAQSGRRAPKPVNDPPVPAPSVDPATLPKPSPTPVNKIALVVGSDPRGSFSLSSFESDIMQRTVIRRLDESNALAPRGGDEMRRDEAQQRARRETDTYIVWLQLEENSVGGSVMIRRDDPENYQIRYAVYEPQTGRTKSQGNIYLRSYGRRRVGGIGLPRGSSNCLPPTLNNFEFALTLGAIEAADRILKSFSLPPLPPCS